MFIRFIVALSLVLGLGGLSFPSAFAGDIFAPIKMSFHVEPGETISYDFSFLSESGGEYELRAESFEYSETGDKDFTDTFTEYIRFPENPLTFVPGEERYIPVEVTIPEGFSGDHLYYSIDMNRLSEQQFSHSIKGHLYLRMGEAPLPALVFGDAARHFSDEAAGIVDYMTFSFDVESPQYLPVDVQYVLLDKGGVERYRFGKEDVLMFPEFINTLNLYNRTGEVLRVAEDMKGILTVLDDEGNVIAQDEVEVFEGGEQFLFTEKVSSPLRGFRIHGWWNVFYHPIFRVFAIGIGLTLMLISFSLKRK